MIDISVKLDKSGNPVYMRPITPADLYKIKPTDLKDMEALHNIMSVYGLENPNTLRNAELVYLQRFNITPDSDGFKQALKNLATESNNKRVIVGTARRISQATETVQALDGQLTKRCVYVNDGDNPCETCLELNGTEMTYTEFVNQNALPGDRCLGGSNCLCLLVPLD